MMNRRAFLARLGFGTVSAAAAALTFDVEKLLWVPSEKTIFVPPPPTIVEKVWITEQEFRLQYIRAQRMQPPIPNLDEFMRQTFAIIPSRRDVVWMGA